MSEPRQNPTAPQLVEAIWDEYERTFELIYRIREAKAIVPCNAAVDLSLGNDLMPIPDEPRRVELGHEAYRCILFHNSGEFVQPDFSSAKPCLRLNPFGLFVVETGDLGLWDWRLTGEGAPQQ